MKKVRNPFERELFQSLKRSKIKFGYEVDKIPYVIEGSYIPDFTVTTKCGNVIYIEAKGHFRREDKRKLCWVKRCHPDLDIRIVFQQKRKTNERWAVKNKFPYAIRNIPKEWLDDR